MMLASAGAASGLSFAAESVAIFAAFTTPPTDARKVVINTLVVALKTAGVWAKLDLLYLLAAADSQAARINWKNPGTFTATAVNSPAFEVDRGYTGDHSTSNLTTNWIPENHGVTCLLNSACLGLWSRTSGQLAESDIGGPNFILNCRNGSDQTFLRVWGGSQITPANTDGSGCFHGNRADANAIEVYRNGVSLGTGSVASISRDAMESWMCGRNNVTPQYSARQQAAGWFGGSLTGAEVLAMYNALAAYMTAVGA